LREVRGVTTGELEELCRVVQVGFGDSEIDWLREQLATEPGYGYWQSRVAVVAGRIVSSAQILVRQLRYGCCLIPTMGIGNVATLPDCRGQGHASAVMRDAAAFMPRWGYPLGMLLADIPDFYRRLGWEVAHLRPACYSPLPAQALPPARAPLVRRERGGLQEGDLARLAAIYDSFNAGQTGPVVRCPAYWQVTAGRRLNHDSEVLITDGAYLALAVLEQHGAVGIAEAACLAGAHRELRALLAEAARLARQADCGLLLAPGPGVLPAAWWEGIGAPAELPAPLRTMPVMLSVLDWLGLLQAIRPELLRRWQAAGAPPLDVTTVHREQAVRLLAAAGTLDVRPAQAGPGAIELSDGQAVWLCLGQWEALPGLREVEALRVLFSGPPYHFWPLDHF